MHKCPRVLMNQGFPSQSSALRQSNIITEREGSDTGRKTLQHFTSALPGNAENLYVTILQNIQSVPYLDSYTCLDEPSALFWGSHPAHVQQYLNTQLPNASVQCRSHVSAFELQSEWRVKEKQTSLTEGAKMKTSFSLTKSSKHTFMNDNEVFNLVL